jgi:hypothetical protein
MTMYTTIDVSEYPFTSDYLHSLIINQNITGRAAREIIHTMQEWLDDNVYRDGKYNYTWSKETTYIGGGNTVGSLHAVSAYIGFKYSDDLLAFKLKFGITT